MVRRRKLVDAFIYGGGIRDVAKGEIIVDRGPIQSLLDQRMNQQRFQLGGEDEIASAHETVIKRFFPEPVARHKQRVLVLVIQREHEHAAEALDASFAPLLPGMDN